MNKITSLITGKEDLLLDFSRKAAESRPAEEVEDREASNVDAYTAEHAALNLTSLINGRPNRPQRS